MDSPLLSKPRPLFAPPPPPKVPTLFPKPLVFLDKTLPLSKALPLFFKSENHLQIKIHIPRVGEDRDLGPSALESTFQGDHNRS